MDNEEAVEVAGDIGPKVVVPMLGLASKDFHDLCECPVVVMEDE